MITDEDQETEESSESNRDVPMLATHSIAALEQAAGFLSAEEPEAELQKWLSLSAVLVARAREIRHIVEKAAVAWIRTHGAIDVGEIRYTVGSRRDVRCASIEHCVQLVLEATGGDVAQFGEYLRADPFRYGSVRNLIGEEQFAKVFRVEIKPKLVAGVPEPELVQTNLRYLPRRKTSRAAQTEPGV